MASAQHFFDTSRNFSYWFWGLLYIVMAVFSCIGLFLMKKTQGWKNYTLLCLLLSMLAYAVLNMVWDAEYITQDFGASPLTNSTINAFDNLCHWTITQAYLKVAF